MRDFFPLGLDARPDGYSPKALMIGGGLVDEKGQVNTPIYNQWLYRGVFFATWEAEGCGTISSYSFSDIMTVAIIVALRKFDIRLKKASKMALRTIEVLEEWFSQNPQVKDIDWPDIYMKDETEVSTEDSKAQAVIRLDIFTIYCNVMGRLEAMDEG